MSSQVTRRQHHVWRYYLEAWTKEGRLFCQDGDRIFKLNPRNAAVETDFYKLNNLTSGDLALLKGLIEKADAGARPLLANFILMFSPEHRIQRVLAAINPSHKHLAEKIISEKLMAEDAIQAEEIYHANIEAAAKETLDLLREEGTEILADGPSLVQFCYFLGVQYFRTKGMKERVLARLSKMAPSEYLTPNSWNIQRHIYATNLGGSIFLSRSRSPIRVLSNRTSTPFITADQPIINLHGKQDGKPPSHMALYYPISPWRAVFIDDADVPLALHSNLLTDVRVAELNARMAKYSFRQRYGLTELSLKALPAS